mmetsp:Transcript_29042/g.35370  ORF Transcript_29042/g.35370 Transcript_29042/m.35370 type:complete len:386 (-) Transcript_29042:700-1857(-)
MNDIIHQITRRDQQKELRELETKIARERSQLQKQRQKEERRQQSEKKNDDDKKYKESKPADWTNVYQKFDSSWNDPDDIKRSLRDLSRKKRGLAKTVSDDDDDLSRRRGGGCLGHDRSHERDVVRMTPAARLNLMNETREEGNALFAEGLYTAALTHYERALLLYEYCVISSSSSSSDGGRRYAKTAEGIFKKCHSNAAACYLELGRYRDAVESCTQALQLDGKNIKALYRRGKARRLLGDYDKAKEDLGATLALDGKKSQELLNERALLKVSVRAYKEREKAVARRIWGSGIGSDGGTVEEGTKDDVRGESGLEREQRMWDGMLTPWEMNVAAAEDIVSRLSGINLMDATIIKQIVKDEECSRSKGTNRADWSFRQLLPCQCKH